MRKVIPGVIALYQNFISPMLPPRCRFYPTCSHYAAEAVNIHGVGKGSWLSIKRIAKCHPFNAGGIDLVPPAAPAESIKNNTLIKGEHTHG